MAVEYKKYVEHKYSLPWLPIKKLGSLEGSSGDKEGNEGLGIA